MLVSAAGVCRCFLENNRVGEADALQPKDGGNTSEAEPPQTHLGSCTGRRRACVRASVDELPCLASTSKQLPCPSRALRSGQQQSSTATRAHAAPTFADQTPRSAT